MSWAEVKKKINSNLDVPLDEVLDEYRNGELIRMSFLNDTTGTYNTSPKLKLSLTGKGKIYGVGCRAEFGGTSYARIPMLTINVDGETLLNSGCQDVSGSSNSKQCLIGIMPWSNIMTIGNLSTPTVVGYRNNSMPSAYPATAQWDANNVYLPIRLTPVQYGEAMKVNDSCFCGYYLNRPIVYKNNVEIYGYNLGVSASSSSNFYWIEYSMD